MQIQFEARIGKVLAEMERQGVELFLVGPGSTLKYLAGYGVKADERLLLLVLSPGRKPFFVANKLYLRQLPIQEGALLWGDGEDAVSCLAAHLAGQGYPTGRVAVSKELPAHFVLPLLEALKSSRLELGGGLTDPLRIYKDEAEREAMRTACRLASQALEAVLDRGRWWLGKSESQFMGQLAFEMTSLGLKLPSGIVAVGEEAAVPHHATADTIIEEGKCLLVDFGGNYQNYNTDMTRTVHFGEPSDEFKKVYDIVLEAQYKGREAARLGNELQEVDRAARGYIASKGYGEFFTHRTGHGIGIDGHEGPSAQEGEHTIIAPGMAFSIEPGIYLPGKFGVRIEDQALITENGLEILHSVPRELRVF